MRTKSITPTLAIKLAFPQPITAVSGINGAEVGKVGATVGAAVDPWVGASAQYSG